METRKKRMSRRHFLGTGLAAAGAAALSACGKVAQETLATVTPGPTRMHTQTSTAAPTQMQTTMTPTPNVTLVPQEMVLVEAGSFMMGSEEGYEDERPVHEVVITRPFYIGVYPVTNAQFTRFKSTVDWADGGGNHPLDRADWNDAVTYCNWLSKLEGLALCYSGKGHMTRCDFRASGYRLPTEAEWEYAARGGARSQGYIYAGSDNPDEVAWYGENSDGLIHPVGQKKPNELGLYDMSGNTNELLWDWYGEDYYVSSPREDPTGPESGEQKVRRGGLFGESVNTMRIAFRSYDGINYPMNGFRPVRTAG
jgi:formylglycine-generating enzyme